jgi:hypothetical protein
VLISVEGIGKNQLKPGQKTTGDSPVLSHCCEGETTYCLTFFRAFPSDCIPEMAKDVNVHFFIHSVPHAETPVNYNSEFQELFEATMYITDSTEICSLQLYTGFWLLY